MNLWQDYSLLSSLSAWSCTESLVSLYLSSYSPLFNQAQRNEYSLQISHYFLLPSRVCVPSLIILTYFEQKMQNTKLLPTLSYGALVRE